MSLLTLAEYPKEDCFKRRNVNSLALYVSFDPEKDRIETLPQIRAFNGFAEKRVGVQTARRHSSSASDAENSRFRVALSAEAAACSGQQRVGWLAG